MNRDLKIIFCNKPYQDYFYKNFGVALDEGDYVLGEWHTQSIINQRKHDYELALTGEVVTSVVEEVFPDRKQYFEITSAPIFDFDDRIVGVNCVSRDITGGVLQSMKISSQNKQLKEIAWIQSHKMRGPVASVLGLLSLIDSENPGNEHNKELLEKLKTAAHGLDDVIKEVVSKTSELDE